MAIDVDGRARRAFGHDCGELLGISDVRRTGKPQRATVGVGAELGDLVALLVEDRDVSADDGITRRRRDSEDVSFTDVEGLRAEVLLGEGIPVGEVVSETRVVVDTSGA